MFSLHQSFSIAYLYISIHHLCYTPPPPPTATPISITTPAHTTRTPQNQLTVVSSTSWLPGQSSRRPSACSTWPLKVPTNGCACNPASTATRLTTTPWTPSTATYRPKPTSAIVCSADAASTFDWSSSKFKLSDPVPSRYFTTLPLYLLPQLITTISLTFPFFPPFINHSPQLPTFTPYVLRPFPSILS